MFEGYLSQRTHEEIKFQYFYGRDSFLNKDLKYDWENLDLPLSPPSRWPNKNRLYFNIRPQIHDFFLKAHFKSFFDSQW